MPLSKNTENAENAENNDDELYDAPVVPWEAPEHYGIVQGFVQTILLVMFSPATFFGQLRYAGAPLTRPIAFFILLGVFQTFAERLWYKISVDMISPSITDPQMQTLINTLSDHTSIPMAVLMSPISLAIQLCIFTAITYLMIRLVQPERAHLPIIVRIICYSAAPTIICIVPFLGPMVSTVWFAVACFIGCKHALDLTWQRTCMALGPLYLVAFAISMQLIRQLLIF